MNEEIEAALAPYRDEQEGSKPLDGDDFKEREAA
jgi:hypothetical protein